MSKPNPPDQKTIECAVCSERVPFRRRSIYRMTLKPHQTHGIDCLGSNLEIDLSDRDLPETSEKIPKFSKRHGNPLLGPLSKDPDPYPRL